MIPWLDESIFEQHVQTLLDAANRASKQAEAKRKKNVIDPFASLLIASIFEVTTPEELIAIQNAESALRGMSNALGRFHQNILGSIEGWDDHDAGYDVICEDRRILAEVKNKWNTLNADNKRAVVQNLETAVRQQIGKWNGYLVQVVPNKPERFVKKVGSRNDVFEIDGASFYDMATADPNAIHGLFESVCEVVSPTSSIAEYCHSVLDTSLPPKI